MGFHVCEYISRDEATALGLKHANRAHSSGDVEMAFSSGRQWRMPDMALLYVELGWLPPAEFIQDVMSGVLLGSFDRRKPFERVGYLAPEATPLPKPYGFHPDLPEGFLDLLETFEAQAIKQGQRLQTKSVASSFLFPRPRR